VFSHHVRREAARELGAREGLRGSLGPLYLCAVTDSTAAVYTVSGAAQWQEGAGLGGLFSPVPDGDGSVARARRARVRATRLRWLAEFNRTGRGTYGHARLAGASNTTVTRARCDRVHAVSIATQCAHAGRARTNLGTRHYPKPHQ
jgi:hypothetical protein